MSGGHGSAGGNAPAVCHGAGFPPSPVRLLNIYRVRPGGREGVWYIWEHRDGKVEIYGRLVGVKAEARARAIAKDANEGAA